LNLGGQSSLNNDSKVPSLDFSNLKHIKENDWYAYSKKLEEVIDVLRNKVAELEKQVQTQNET
jgi:hypothetical protein